MHTGIIRIPHLVSPASVQLSREPAHARIIFDIITHLSLSIKELKIWLLRQYPAVAQTEVPE
jgi:hypothetical protein